MRKTAILLLIVTLFSKGVGFFREITLSFFYGASNVSDVYLISLSIPTALFGFLVTGISSAYIPMYSQIELDKGKSEANKYTNNTINVLMIICVIIAFFGLIFTEEIVRVFASGFEGETLRLAVRFTEISMFGIFATGLISIFSAYLQIYNDHVITALIGFPMNIITIISIIISAKTNNIVLAYGSLLATWSQLFFLIPFVSRRGFRYQRYINFKDKYIKKLAYIALPVILGSSLSEVNALIDKTIASRVAEGGISALNYSGRISDLILGLFVATLATLIYPSMSKMAAKKDMDGLKKITNEAITTVNILIIPATIGLMIFSESFIKLLFARGAFTDEALKMTAGALFFYALGNPGYGLRQILYRVFYSVQDTRTPMINSAISIVINIVLNIVLSRYMGINGLALATSISAFVCTVLLFVSLRKKIGPLGMKKIGVSFIKIIAASLIMGIIAKLSNEMMNNYMGDNIALIVSIVIAIVAYFIIISFLKIEEVDSLLDAVKEKIKSIIK